ncbi:hypothetical protein CPB86DRAFT_80688 [Serendipita vermifera]|nr:hypothetical protein CPB86DRAFT_80688 [Serendipita vermifera]
MDTCIEELPTSSSPDRSDDDGSSMSTRYDELSGLLQEHERCREKASSPEAVAEMTQWHGSKSNSSFLREMNQREIEAFCLPAIDRDYRQSIYMQQKKAAELSRWHNTSLLVHLERHQHHSEDIQQFIQKMGGTYSALCTKLMDHLSQTQDQTQKFSSPDFIADAYDDQQLESEHAWMQPVAYTDFVTGETSSVVVLGTERAIAVRQKAMDLVFDGKRSLSYASFSPLKKKALELERRFRIDASINETLKTFSQEELRIILYFTLLSDATMLPLEDEEIKRYSISGVTRDNLQTIMNRVPEKYRQSTYDLVLFLWSEGFGATASVLFTHRPIDDVWRVMDDIFDKWDFRNHRPLPRGVKRNSVGPGKTELVYEKSGLPYESQ